MYFPVDSLNSENTVSVSRKIKISPTKEQSQIFKSWLGCYRYVYNKTLEAIQKEAKTPKWFSVKTEMIKGLPEWAGKIPYQIKSMAIKEAITNLKQQKKIAKFKNKPFRMKYKSRKAPQQSCYIPKSAIKTSGIYPSISGNLYYHEELPKLIQDSRLIYTNNKFYICVPTTKERSLSDNQGRVVAIDPGIRKFITFVSHDSAGKLGENDIGRIYRLCFWLDNLYSRMSKVKAKQRRRMKQAASRVRAKIRDLIDELHHKSARFLVDNFDVILLPSFETSEMVIKKGRKIRSKTARAMLTFSFYRFKQFLKNKALECGKVVLDCCEAYTSKTNNFTGVIDSKLGGRTYVKVGDRRIDRDINGALGILLKALVDTPSLRVCLDSQRANVNIS